MFDYEGARELQEEARELGRSAGFAPPVVSAGIDLLLNVTRAGDQRAAARLLPEVEAAVERLRDGTSGCGGCASARAEFNLAESNFESAAISATESITLSRTRRRPKCEALGLITRARALHALGRTAEAVADARDAVSVAGSTSDVALELVALGAIFSRPRPHLPRSGTDYLRPDRAGAAQ